MIDLERPYRSALFLLVGIVAVALALSSLRYLGVARADTQGFTP